jgi:hypothetical protein
MKLEFIFNKEEISEFLVGCQTQTQFAADYSRHIQK